jgi:hypothetical protein
MPSPMNAQESVTEAMPTSVLQRPQFEQSSLAGKLCGQGPVMAFGALSACTDATTSSRRSGLDVLRAALEVAAAGFGILLGRAL